MKVLLFPPCTRPFRRQTPPTKQYLFALSVDAFHLGKAKVFLSGKGYIWHDKGRICIVDRQKRNEN